jgi:NAD(P)-dependent dehydrogenase (short-subunit alcohol dehydrogenase family)
MVSGSLAGQKGSVRQLTRDKLETVMQTNYFGHFLLTNLLKEALKKSDDPRVVNVSSMYNMKGVIDVDNLNGEIKFDGELVS